MAPVLGVFSGLMLGVCLIAKSALERAAGRQTAEAALRNSEEVTRQTQNELSTLKSTLQGIQENEPRNAALIESLNAKILELSVEVERLTIIETDLNEKLHKANKLEKQIEGTCEQFREAITHLQADKERLQSENTTLKNKAVEPVATEPPQQVSKSKSMFNFGGSIRK